MKQKDAIGQRFQGKPRQVLAKQKPGPPLIKRVMEKLARTPLNYNGRDGGERGSETSSSRCIQKETRSSCCWIYFVRRHFAVISCLPSWLTRAQISLPLGYRCLQVPNRVTKSEQNQVSASI